jgi:hypothetical protein
MTQAALLHFSQISTLAHGPGLQFHVVTSSQRPRRQTMLRLTHTVSTAAAPS